MKTHPRSIQLLAVALASWGLAPVSAQTPAAGTVTGHGAAEIRRQPEFLRVQVEVLAKGKDLFKNHCATCHSLFNEGGKTAPDLTGADRTRAEQRIQKAG